MRRRALLLALLIAAAVSLGQAQSRSIVLESFDVEVLVLPAGTIEVTETIRPRFSGSWNGIIRSLPVEYRTPQDFNYSLLLEMQKITDENGVPLRWERKRVRHYQEFKIWVPGAYNATRTVVLRYRVPNALGFYEQHDELYWNVTGDEWEMPIESASALIRLPPEASGLRAAAFTGAYGSTARDAVIDIIATQVSVRVTRPLNFREGLTVVVGWDKGLVREPSALAKAGLFLRSNWPFFFPVGVFAFMFALWYTRGRDPAPRSIAARYEPPDGLTPAELGTLVDNTPDMRDITATIVDLAVRGYLLIEEREKEELLGLWKGKDYYFRLRKAYRGTVPDLKPHELKLLDSMFLGRERSHVEGVLATVTLSDLQNRFYQHLPDLRDLIYRRLIERGCYTRRPDTLRNLYVAIGVIVGAASIPGGHFLAASLGISQLTFTLAGLLSGASIAGFGWFMPVRTLRGTRLLESVLGFEEFLERVESDRLQRMLKTPEVFEKCLPYAMALGVEKNWVSAFANIYKQPPEWYRGQPGYVFQPHSFVGDLRHMASSTAEAMTSAPRTSGRSGFGGGGGGGFSGGGFGGGGGRGF